MFHTYSWEGDSSVQGAKVICSSPMTYLGANKKVVSLTKVKESDLTEWLTPHTVKLLLSETAVTSVTEFTDSQYLSVVNDTKE